MSLSRVQIISNALTQLGKKPISSLSGQGDLVMAADQAFDMLLPSSLSEGQWRFACAIQQLSQLVDVPIAGYWQYAYALPSDFLKMIHLWPHNYEFELYENRKLYSNLDSPLYIEYVFQPDITNLPMYFVKYFVYELAAYLALSSAQSAQYFNVIETKRAAQFAIALAVDAQNRPQTPIQSKPIISTRYVSTYCDG